MDLGEYLFYEKRKDKNFSREKFAKKLGISKNYLDQIVTFKRPIVAHLAYKIEKATNGQVSGWELIKKQMEGKDEN